MKSIIILIASLWFSSIAAQEIKYVNAENGLFLRTEPNREANRIGKLVYGSKVEIINKTGIALSVVDNGITVGGEWVQIRDTKTSNRGYVFNGYLSSNKINRRMPINLDKFILLVDMEDTCCLVISDVKKDTLNIHLDLGYNPFEKKITIRQSKWKKVEIFQKQSNSVYLSWNKEATCELLDQKEYPTSWKELKLNKDNNVFLSEVYSEAERNELLKTSIEELLHTVNENCNSESSGYIKNNIKYIKENSTLSPGIIYLKLLLTDENDILTEKTIVFHPQLDC